MQTGTLLLACACASAAGPDDSTTISAIRTAYTANRAAMPFGTLRFEFAVGYTRDIEAARRGELSRKIARAGSYFFDGSSARFELVYSTEVMERFSRNVQSRRVLTNGKLTLWDCVDLDPKKRQPRHMSQIDAGTRPFFHHVLCPLDIGNPQPQGYDLGHNLDAALKPGEWTIGVAPDAVYSDGSPAAHIVMTDSVGFARHYWVDVERGAIPREIRDIPTEGMGMRICYDDLRRVNDIAWLPFKMTIWDDAGYTKQLVISEANFSKRPARKDFALEFPEPEPMINAAALVHYAPRKTWDLERLPPPGSHGAHRITLVEPTPAAPDLPAQSRSGFSRVTICLIVVGAIALAAAAVGAWRRTHHGFST